MQALTVGLTLSFVSCITRLLVTHTTDVKKSVEITYSLIRQNVDSFAVMLMYIVYISYRQIF